MLPYYFYDVLYYYDYVLQNDPAIDRGREGVWQIDVHPLSPTFFSDQSWPSALNIPSARPLRNFNEINAPQCSA